MFAPATKEKAKLRLALGGVSGSGKTFTALRIATAIGGRIAVIDSEHGSASKYADQFSFDTENITDYSPENYMRLIDGAVKGGYNVLVIDSLSHAWSGANGTLDQVEKWSSRNPKGDSFRAWGQVGTPLQNKFIDHILAAPIHIIGCVRVKQEYAMVDGDRGKKVVQKLGLAPVQRDGLEYEFDVYGMLDEDNRISFPKTRCPGLFGKIIEKPGEDVANILMSWLSTGVEPTKRTEPQPGQVMQSGTGWVDPLPDPPATPAPAPLEWEQELSGQNRHSEALEKALTLFDAAGLTGEEIVAYLKGNISEEALPVLRKAYADAMKHANPPTGGYLREALGKLLDPPQEEAA